MRSLIRSGPFLVHGHSALGPQHIRAIVNCSYEGAEIALCKEMLKTGDRVLEIGTGIGLVSLSIAQIVGAENLRSFEANPDVAEAARKNGALNGYALDIRNRVMVGRASKHWPSGQCPFFIDKNFLASSLARTGTQRTEITVEAVAIDAELSDFRPTAIVADVEGAEQDLFEGLTFDDVQTLIIELHPSIIGAPESMALLSRLGAVGFSVDLSLVRSTVVGLRRGASPALPVGKDSDRTLQSYLEANVAFQMGQYAETINLLEMAIALAPNVTEFSLLLAQTHLHNGNCPAVCELLERRDAVHPLDDRELHFLSIARFRLSEFQAAQHSLDRLSPAASALPQNIVTSARVALKQGQLNEAHRLATAALDIAPSVTDYLSTLELIEEHLARAARRGHHGANNAQTVDAPKALSVARGEQRSAKMENLRELILHIGLPKTATSFIQRWLVVNAKNLRQRGIWVPPRQIDAHRLAAEGIVNPLVLGRGDTRHILTTPFDESIRSLVDAAALPRYNSLVVSSEYFYEADPQVVFDKIAAPAGLPTRIILMLRRQDRIVESGYNQSVKAMGMTDPTMVPRYLTNLNWYDLIDNWAKVFGKDRICVLNYDQSAIGGTVLSDFARQIDSSIEATELQKEFVSVPMSNESLPADLLEFKRLANSFGEFGLDKLLHRMIESGYKGPPFRMSPEKAQEFIALYGESNERVAKEVLGYTSPLFSNYGGPGEREGVELYGKLPVETLVD